MNLRLTVVIRKDLQLEATSVGLFGAQVKHTADMWLFKRVLDENGPIEVTEDEKSWMRSPYFYVHEVNTREEMDELVDKAKIGGDVEVHVWEDTIPARSLGGSIKVPVAFSIGPCDTDIIKRIIGKLFAYGQKQELP